MYLFIFESIGTSELILIGAVALIVFGPRKLPQMAKTLGKAMADFKNTTNEFKTTWEREANFEETSQNNEIQILQQIPESSQIEITDGVKSANMPEIKEIDTAQFNLPRRDENQTEKEATAPAGKQNWL